MRTVDVVMLRNPRNRRKGFYIVRFNDINKLAWFITRPENEGRIYRYRFLSKKMSMQLMHKVFSLSQKS